jgi:transposase-like protein
MLFPPDIYLDSYLPYDTRQEEHSPMQNCLLSLLYSRKLELCELVFIVAEAKSISKRSSQISDTVQFPLCTALSVINFPSKAQTSRLKFSSIDQACPVPGTRE